MELVLPGTPRAAVTWRVAQLWYGRGAEGGRVALGRSRSSAGYTGTDIRPYLVLINSREYPFGHYHHYNGRPSPLSSID